VNTSVLSCEDERRRQEVRKERLYGLDYIEVDDRDQRVLKVHFIGKAPESIPLKGVLIEGGRRIRGIKAVDVDIQQKDGPDADDCMKITVDKPGDFSIYTLHLAALDRNDEPTGKPLDGFDPRYAQLEFSFKAGCTNDLDCKRQVVCPQKRHTEPEINYLAKDYASFRQLILDRLALIMPDWTERHVPDLNVTLVEILAYVGDYLSYYQDAVATEAYLATSRQRISVRRHVRLVDYIMHEGCNSRAFVCAESREDLKLPARDIYFITGSDAALPGSVLSPEDLRNVPSNNYEVFEPLVFDQIPSKLDPEDIRGIDSLVIKLKEPKDPLSRCLREELSAKTRELLDTYNASRPSSTPHLNDLIEDLKQALICDLNRLINAGNISRTSLENAYPAEIEGNQKISVYANHSKIQFYTWGDKECCLLKGATSATLFDGWTPAESQPETPGQYQKYRKEEYRNEAYRSQEHKRLLNLKAGDILIFEEVIGPQTGDKADADPAHRHAVRLIKDPQKGIDPLRQKILGHEEDMNALVLEIEWAPRDALPFPLCISALSQECDLIENVSVARGNVILVDHGSTVAADSLGSVATGETSKVCDCNGLVSEIVGEPTKFYPSLQGYPLTFCKPLQKDASARDILYQETACSDLKAACGEARPQVRLIGMPSSCQRVFLEWSSRSDLLSSHSQDRHFVAEIDDDGRAHLRFGDGDLGKIPASGMEFQATYRIGNGVSGNVGSEMISRIVFRRDRQEGITLIRNPLPAEGGTDPETLDEVKLLAPGSFRKDLQRAVTADDYARLAECNPRVQKAAAALLWTGSWYEALIAIDQLGKVEPDQDLLDEIEKYLEGYRRLGHDLRVVPASHIPLDITINVCIKPHYQRGHVKATLLDLFSNRILPDGSLGFFHPDNLSFGDGIFLSKIVAATQAVDGVKSITVTKLERFGVGPNHEIENGILPLGPLEIVQVDNDPSFPENGRFMIEIQ
jgi:predicted phage baseplate assembly protein